MREKEGRRKYKSQSVQTHASLNQRPPVTSQSGPIVQSQHHLPHASTSARDILQSLSNSQIHNSVTSMHQQVPMVSFSCERNVQEHAGIMPRSSPASSTSSTLSLLFGKISFSSALVISGLSVADGGNTTDTHSSSSVNITNFAMGPSGRAGNNAKQKRPVETSEISDTTESDQLKDESPTHVVIDSHVLERAREMQKDMEQLEENESSELSLEDES